MRGVCPSGGGCTRLTVIVTLPPLLSAPFWCITPHFLQANAASRAVSCFMSCCVAPVQVPYIVPALPRLARVVPCSLPVHHVHVHFGLHFPCSFLHVACVVYTFSDILLCPACACIVELYVLLCLLPPVHVGMPLTTIVSAPLDTDIF